MADRKTITVDAQVYSALEADKREDETWTDLMERLLTPETGSGRDERDVNAPDPLTEDHIDDIASQVARTTADEVENRLTRR